MSRIRTFTKIIDLGTAFDRSMGTGNHWIGSPIKAFRVVDTNNDDFQLTLTADPDNGSVEGLDLSYTRIHNYTTLANRGVFENKILQPGVYVKVLISVEDDFIYSGQKNEQNFVTILEGSAHTSERVDLANNTIVEIIPADDDRAMGTLQLKSGGKFWVGNPAELGDADYKNICQEINLSVGETFEWRNFASLNAKTDQGACVFSLIQEIKQ